jgi:hypothetical protein
MFEHLSLFTLMFHGNYLSLRYFLCKTTLLIIRFSCRDIYPLCLTRFFFGRVGKLVCLTDFLPARNHLSLFSEAMAFQNGRKDKMGRYKGRINGGYL